MIMNHEYEKDARSHVERMSEGGFLEKEQNLFIFPYSHAPHTTFV